MIMEAQKDIDGHITLTYCGPAIGYFDACNQSWEKSKIWNIIELKYFSFTTLSTVGFGDFHPYSSSERIFIAFGMLLGVAIFSSILGNFIEMIDVIKEAQEDF